MANTDRTSPGAAQDFRQEFMSVVGQFEDKRLFIGLFLAWVALFQFLGNSTFGYVDSPSLFQWMHSAYNAKDSEDSHGILVPFVVLALLWWKRKALLAIPRKVWLPGLAGLGLCLGLHILGYVVQQPRASILAMFAGIFALVAIVWGWRFAAGMIFPLFLLAFCVPLGALAEPITVPLRQVSTDISVGVARHALGIPVLQEGVQIIDPRGAYSYEVAVPCSGIRSLITLLALTTVYGFMTFTTGWRRLLMVAVAVPLALFSNVARLVAIVVAAEAFGQSAGEFVHNYFGYVTFGVALVAVLALGHWLREPEAPAAAVTD